jgi:hypothetical protein
LERGVPVFAGALPFLRLRLLFAEPALAGRTFTPLELALDSFARQAHFLAGKLCALFLTCPTHSAPGPLLARLGMRGI